MVKKIAISDLKVGMHVEDVFNDKGFLLFSANSRVTDKSQILRLKKQGVKSVFIRYSDEPADEPAPSGVRDPLAPHTPIDAAYRQDLVFVKNLYGETMHEVHETLRNARMGRAFTIEPIEKCVEIFARMLDADPNILFTIGHLKRYDRDTYVHSVNVGMLLAVFARSAGYSGSPLLDCCAGGMLHDIGKMRVPETVLNKTGKYTKHEFEIMQRHPRLGSELLQANHALTDIASDVVNTHHERYNGTGYPLGLKGKTIGEIGLMAGIVDMFDAMTTRRPHREAYMPQEALALMFQASDELFPRALVEQFTKLVGIYPVGSFVKFESGEMGIVIHNNPRQLLKPVVLLMFNSRGERMEEPFEVDLSARGSVENTLPIKIESSLHPASFDVEPSLVLQKVLLTGGRTS